MSDRTDGTGANVDRSGRGRSDLVKALLEILRYPAAAAFLFLFVFQLGGVNGPSMPPSLDDGTFFIGARWAKPDYRDIVVINFSAFGEPIIKRVIGLPGDRVLCSGSVWLNRQPLEEPYVAYSGGSDRGN